MKSDSRMSAYELLEFIQKEYLKLKGLDHSLDVDRAVAEEVMKEILGKEDVSEEYSMVQEMLNASVLKTKYQNPYTYGILNDIVQSIEKIKADIFRNMDLDIKMPCFGTVDYDVFSAEICAANCDEKLIIISDGLFTFANLISKIMTQIFPLEKDDDIQRFSADIEKIKRQIEDNKEIKLRFFDLMLACIVTKEPPRAKPYIIDFRLNALLSVIRESFEIFVVAHEYSHSILGHLEDKKINSTSKIEELSDSEIKEIFHSWEDEIMADVYGAGITLAIMNKKKFDPYVSMLGIIVCMNSFVLFDKIEQLRQGNSDKQKISKSHPSGAMREKFVEQQYFENKDLGLFKMIDTLFADLWDEFEVFFGKLSDIIEKTTKMDIYEIPFEVTQSLMYHIIGNNKSI